jgi:hypothetical protein
MYVCMYIFRPGGQRPRKVSYWSTGRAELNYLQLLSRWTYSSDWSEISPNSSAGRAFDCNCREHKWCGRVRWYRVVERPYHNITSRLTRAKYPVTPAVVIWTLSLSERGSWSHRRSRAFALVPQEMAIPEKAWKRQDRDTTKKTG